MVILTSMRIVGTLALAVAILPSAACGNTVNKTTACVQLHNTVLDTSKKAMSQVTDPNALAQTYRGAAGTMRRQGKDSGDADVEKAADHVATAFETLAGQLRSLSGGTPTVPDGTALISAEKELTSACRP